MNKEELLRYKSILNEIDLLKYQLAKVKPEITTDSVKGSTVDFPYTECNFKLSGIDESSYYSKVSRLERKIRNKMHELVDEKDKLLSYIYEVDDSCLRQILIYKYLEGLTFSEIGSKLGYAEITVRKKHSEFIKCIA